MSDTLAPLILDLLRWLAPGPRAYHDVMDAWRTSCPRLTVWEDALDAGLIACNANGNGPVMVELTKRGRELIQQRRLAQFQ